MDLFIVIYGQILTRNVFLFWGVVGIIGGLAIGSEYISTENSVYFVRAGLRLVFSVMLFPFIRLSKPIKVLVSVILTGLIFLPV